MIIEHSSNAPLANGSSGLLDVCSTYLCDNSEIWDVNGRPFVYDHSPMLEDIISNILIYPLTCKLLLFQRSSDQSLYISSETGTLVSSWSF